MSTSNLESTSSGSSNAQEPGYRLKSPCGREYFVSKKAVLADYAQFLVDEDGLTLEEALTQANKDPTFGDTWFAEQYIWADVVEQGVLVKDASPEDVTRALDFLRDHGGGGTSGYTHPSAYLIG